MALEWTDLAFILVLNLIVIGLAVWFIRYSNKKLFSEIIALEDEVKKLDSFVRKIGKRSKPAAEESPRAILAQSTLAQSSDAPVMRSPALAATVTASSQKKR